MNGYRIYTTLMLEELKSLKRNDFVSISIPRNLFNRIGQEIGNTSPKAVSKYIIYILEKKLSSEEKRVYTEEDKRTIKERLHKLGYF